MKLYGKIIIVVCILIIALTGCSCSSNDLKKEWDGMNPDKIEERIIRVLWLDLFDERGAYDSCHYLMIPMRWCFKMNRTKAIQEFNNLYDRFVDYGEKDESFQSLNGLSKNHWYYLMSEYLCLCQENNIKYNQELANHIIVYIMSYYENHHGNWGAYKRYDNLYDLFDGLLYGQGYESGNSLNRTITDNELFPLAIMCNMNYLVNNNSNIRITEQEKEIISKSQHYADELVKNDIEWNSIGGWLFQPGGFDDHTDYKYVGYKKISDINPSIPKPLTYNAWDTSHFSRWPMFIISFERNATDKLEYDNLRKGLAVQLNRVVFSGKDDDGFYRMNNFMDGRNGVFAYNVKTGRGMDAFESSSSMFIGWWSLLNDKDIDSKYLESYELIKQCDKMPTILSDSKTTRERYKELTELEWYKLIMYCAVSMT